MCMASPRMDATAITVHVFAIAAVVFSIQVISKLFKNKNKGRKNLPPSPPSLPFLGHLSQLKGPLHQSLAHLSARHGPILLLRFGNRSVLSVSSSAIAEECFTTNDVALADRPHFPSTAVTTYNHTSLPFASYGSDWRKMRRIAADEALSGQRLAFFTNVRVDEVRSLARSLFRDFESGEDEFVTVDLRPRLFGLAMNVVMRIIAGKRYYGEEDEEGKYAKRFEDVINEILTYSGASNIGDFLPPIFGWIARLGVGRKLSKAQNYRDEIFQSLIDERRRKRKENEMEKKSTNIKTMIDALISLQEKQPEQYSDVFIKGLLVSLQSAGTDTSSNTIEWAMSLLLNNPEKLEKAREEIDREVGSSGLLEEADFANKLPYLQCIVSETLRLYPAGPLLMPHAVREECQVGGYDIPVGTIVLVNAYAIQRDPELWEEPSRFLPERFLDAGKEARRMLPFGMGRRKCPGEGLAMREMGLVLGTLIQCFDWKRVGKEEVDMTQGSGLTMPRAHALKAIFKPRQVMIDVLSQL